MKPIRRHKLFDKHFKKRISNNKKLTIQFEEGLNLFILGKRDRPLDDHSLTGPLAGKRAFSITGDVRVIYEETLETIIFLDIGTHSQVYK